MILAGDTHEDPLAARGHASGQTGRPEPPRLLLMLTRLRR